MASRFYQKNAIKSANPASTAHTDTISSESVSILLRKRDQELIIDLLAFQNIKQFCRKLEKISKLRDENKIMSIINTDPFNVLTSHP